MFSMIEMFVWGLVGVLELNREKIGRVDYGLIWIALMAHIVKEVIEAIP